MYRTPKSLLCLVRYKKVIIKIENKVTPLPKHHAVNECREDDDKYVCYRPLHWIEMRDQSHAPSAFYL